jgi:hypothetical protein
MFSSNALNQGISICFALASLLPAAPAQAYEIEQHYQANNCEFYVEVFGLGDYMQGTDTFQSIDIDLRVNDRDLTEQKDTVLAASAEVLKKTFAAALNEQGQPVLMVSETKIALPMAEHLSGSLYKMRHSFARVTESMSSYEEVRGLAFYIDVERKDGSIVRLWQTNNGRLFSIDEIFRDPPAFEHSVGIGVIRYPAASSPVYYQRHACDGR